MNLWRKQFKTCDPTPHPRNATNVNITMIWITTLLILTLGTLDAVESTFLDYSDMSLGVVPRSDMFDWTTSVDLSSNLINSVEDYDFANLPQLTTIKINDNNIGSISKLAFENSTLVTQLHFQNNKMSCLCDFSHLQTHSKSCFLIITLWNRLLLKI